MAVSYGDMINWDSQSMRAEFFLEIRPDVILLFFLQKTICALLYMNTLYVTIIAGSYKYVYILVSLRNTSFKFLVARIPNPVARRKMDTLHNTLFYVAPNKVTHALQQCLKI